MQSFNLSPSPPLKPYIEYFNVVQTGDIAPATIVGQPADAAQLIISFGAPTRLANSGALTKSTALMLVGPNSTSDLIELVRGLDAISVVFRPGCAGLFLHAPTAEFTKQMVDLETVWPAELKQVFHDLEDLPPRLRIQRLEALLLTRLNERFDLPPYVARALELSERAKGQVRVRKLADEVGVSERTLQRHMSALIGLTPKQLARVLRIRHTASFLHSTPEANWAELALECGFSDQAHLTNEMVALTRHTPTEFTKLHDNYGFFLKPGTLG